MIKILIMILKTVSKVVFSEDEYYSIFKMKIFIQSSLKSQG